MLLGHFVGIRPTQWMLLDGLVLIAVGCTIRVIIVCDVLGFNSVRGIGSDARLASDLLSEVC